MSDEIGMKTSAPPVAMPTAEHERRVRRLISALRRKGLDGAFITSPVSRLYYTGLESTAGTLLVDVAEGPVFVVDFRYILMAKRAMPFAKCVLQRAGMPSQVVKSARRWRKCGYERRESVEAFERLKSNLGTPRDWTPIDDEIAAQRSVKSPIEIKAIRKAVAANDALFSRVFPQIEPGMTEWEARGIFRREADVLGQGEAFATIVCAGRNGAECHHEPDATVIRPRDTLLMDFGVKVDRYCSDMTRCAAFGKPSPFYREIYSIVLDANRKVISRLRPGMTGKEVDAIARRHISRTGYGDAFAHSLGHSLGLEIHEGPNFSPAEKREIKPGMTITVEPGIYLPGRLGIRIEDVVLVTDKGCECLSSTPRAI